MYLKSIEIIGFKSFANKTKLELKPGMTAIVGPNGCGKSNVSDAVRWVLGEQRARALRGSNMQDIIFNGTDKSKPMGMAEVSITLGDCNNILDTDYDEVCITRRIYRSNESGYFINRKACRLKDIQRLFMDTGIGTDSYSVLEQGKIDQILSARPDDRRAVFEEASGITKFKADKKEALSKLEKTESNLLRLEDVIKEVKRQIISLQRQAGKARRYKELSAEIKTLDLYISGKQVEKFNSHIMQLDTNLNEINKSTLTLQEIIQNEEEKADIARNSLGKIEESISKNLEIFSDLKSEIEQAKQLILVNKDRIIELEDLAERNNQETYTAKEKLENHEKDFSKLETSSIDIKNSLSDSKENLDIALNEQKLFENEIKDHQIRLTNMRTQSIEADQKISKLQNELNLIDAHDRESLLKRERLQTEKKELTKSIDNFDRKENEMSSGLKDLINQIQKKKDTIEKLTNDKNALDKEFRSRKLKELLEQYQSNSITLNDLIYNIEVLFEINPDEKNQINILISELEIIKRKHANQEGEIQMVQHEKTSLNKRLEIVTFELKDSEKDTNKKVDIRASLASEIEKERDFQTSNQLSIKEVNEHLVQIEKKRTDIFEYTTEKRLKHSENLQNLSQFNARKEPLIARIKELNELIKERSAGVNNYTERSIQLKNDMDHAEQKIDPLSQKSIEINQKLESQRKERENNLYIVTNVEIDLREKRTKLENLLEKKYKLDIDKAETVLRNESLITRITNDYQISIENISEQKIPDEWNNSEIPTDDEIENKIAEIRAKLDLMGPVNLVAIDEHEEYEERYTFLMKEQSDLLTAKQQILEMIKKINKTTTDLFIETFNKVNNEFQIIFKDLFGGGSAKLVLTDEDDILEAGIEIIARPPGKKLQSISLLSGGERTMTAVALLFSLFKVKPSPFCVLDELDAALDDANISRFVSTLKNFIKESQFVIITHNRQTIAEASVIYGVTMESKGISKIVSMQFSDFEKKSA